MPAIDYDILARQHGGIPLVDYDTLARKFGGEALKPIHHDSNDVEELRASAERQAPKIGDAVKTATGNVPGAKLEAVRDSKDTDRIEDKAERQQVSPSQVGDIAAAKVTVPDQAAADKVLEKLPVVSKEGEVTGEPGNNAVRQTQAHIDTGAAPGESVRHAEILLQTPEMHAATEETHSKYREAQELRAQGKEAEARQLEAKITADHQAAHAAALARQGGKDAISEPSRGTVGERQQGQVEGQNGRGRIQQSEQGAQAAAPSTQAAQKEASRPTAGANGQSPVAPKPPGTESFKGQQVEVRDAHGQWKPGTVLADNTMQSGSGPIRRLRGTFTDGTKFDNVKAQDVRKPETAKLGVDFDGTLFTQNADGSIGKPIPERIASLKQDIAAGKNVEIESHRARLPGGAKAIQDALESVGLPRLPVTAKKTATPELVGDKEPPERGVKVDEVQTNANTPLPGGVGETTNQAVTSVGEARPEKNVVPKTEAVAENRGAGVSSEAGPEPKYKFGNTQAPIPKGSEASTAIEAARARISDSDLAGKGKEIGDGGNHVTVRYGIKGDDTAKIKKFLSQQAPFEARLGKTQKFPPSEHSDGAAVIVAPIEAKDLHRLNAELERHGDFTESSFSQYKPHATIAYVDPAKAERYTAMNLTAGKKFTVDRIAITDTNGNAEIVKLNGPKSGQAPVPSKPRPASVKIGDDSSSIGHKEAFQLAKDKLGKGAKWEELLRETSRIQQQGKTAVK